MKVQLHHPTEKLLVSFKVKSISRYNKNFVVFKGIDISQDMLEYLSQLGFGYTDHNKGEFQPKRDCQFDVVE